MCLQDKGSFRSESGGGLIRLSVCPSICLSVCLQSEPKLTFDKGSKVSKGNILRVLYLVRTGYFNIVLPIL